MTVKLYGRPLFDLPQDLYIPPDALQVFLEQFEGPLDVLLYLIRKQNLNILDIPMAVVTRQYLAYVEELKKHHLELAAEYLLMAAMLIEIKSRLLLPQKTKHEADPTPDPRADLVKRLLVYEQMKQAAQTLQQHRLMDRDFWCVHAVSDQIPEIPPPQVQSIELQQILGSILQRAKWVQHHTITREALSVREYMSGVLRTLQGRSFVEFADLFPHQANVAVVVVTFVAILELAKELLIEITQAEAYAPIYARLAFTPHRTSS